ncbi:MAG: AAA family ATPase [Chloroflexota bacterium]|nr:AAA family ATPase [Chloroflexota bacterium]
MNARITQIHVKNFRSIAEIRADLGNLTVLVGKNGAGKSNFVDVLRFVTDALQRGLDNAITERGGMGRLRRWSKKGRPFDVVITLSFLYGEIKIEYTLTLGSQKRNEYAVKRESYRYDEIVQYEIENGVWKVEPMGTAIKAQDRTLILPLVAQRPEIKPFYDFLTATSFYSIFPNDELRNPQRPSNDYPLERYGRNMASVLKTFLGVEARRENMERNLDTAIPGVSGVVVTPVSGFLVTQLKHDDGSLFDLSQESDGTLRILALMIALYQEPPRTFLGIEEPELTIHPGAAGILCDVIKEAATRSQIIVTTHSPDLISRFDVNDLRVVERTIEGTQIGIVDAAQREAIETHLFQASDLLRIDGELRRQPSES